nr:MAG TPA: hypothetical protein [Caudoviricetes sp.]
MTRMDIIFGIVIKLIQYTRKIKTFIMEVNKLR